VARSVNRPIVFVGSSTPALSIAKEVKRGLLGVAEVLVWDKAFDAGTWLLGGILNQAQQSDFGVFVIRQDDTARIKRTNYTTVRDNVLFEAGIFMGALGPQRTLLLWPSGHGSEKLRLPSDLAGLLRESYVPPRSRDAKPDLRSALASMRRRIQSMGIALRSGYNEIATLKETLHERDMDFSDGTSESLLAIIERAALSRQRPWYLATSVACLTSEIAAHYVRSIVDQIFWWLIVYGVITFDNIDHWNDGNWDYRSSVEYAVFTERGLVLLNELRTARSVEKA
jgi:hypothetical protein